MPLRDHFVPPLSNTHPWSGFLRAWAVTITQQLNGNVLPARYHALPAVEFDGSTETDVTTPDYVLERASPGTEQTFQTWAPLPPNLSLTVDFGSGDTIEVQVLHDDGGPRLVAAIELVTPKNKDRPPSRRTLAVKCASYLHQAVSVIVIDVVTVCHANMDAEIFQALDLGKSEVWQSPSGLSAVAYRVARQQDQYQIESWSEALALGAPLPCLPLWLGVSVCVPLDLERSYLAACESLRITN